ncbi:YihY/virulence factor BrkB family protein, partial [Xanthovirga aplysinae]|uniref:YihY/virulence factor BrkB family protein n=1 Tax=Xanthovirga aplysinae TaxID=2529853 RepID=UPI001656B4C4
MKSRIQHYVQNIRSYNRLIERLRATRLKESEVSWYTIIQIFLRKIVQDNVFQVANGVAFSFTLATFPAIIFLFTLIPYIPVEGLDHQIMDFLKEVMPSSLFKSTAATINDILSRRRGGLMSFGFAFALLMSTNGMAALMAAFNRCRHTRESRGFLKLRWVAGVLTFLLVIVLLLAIFLLIVGQQIINFLVDHNFL